MKNVKSLITGATTALFFIFALSGIFQYVVILLFGVDVNGFQLSINGLIPIFVCDENIGNYTFSFLLLLPVLSGILFIELSFFILSKLANGFVRYSTIVFLIIISGHLIVSVFYGLIKLILFPSNLSIWEKLTGVWQLEENQIYGFVFFIILVLFGYLQIMQKRLMQYLIVNKSN